MAISKNGQTINNILESNPFYCNEHEKTLLLFNSLSFCNLWQNKNVFYYQSRGRNIASGSSKDIQKAINVDLGLNLSIVSAWNLNNIDLKGQILIQELIPYEVFNPLTSALLYFNSEDYKWYKNNFHYTEYLKLREEPKEKIVSLSKSFIYTFIYNMVTNEDDFKYIMNWLVKFFQNLKSSSSLVLVGDRSVSDNIFWEEILVPIFGKEFCLNINSSVLKKEKYSKAFVSDKIFYNVNSLNYFSAKSKKTKEFISELTTNEKSQTLFNFTTENRPVLQSLGDYKTIKIKSLKNIVKDMGYSSEKKIYKEIDKDLMNFSKILATQ